MFQPLDNDQKIKIMMLALQYKSGYDLTESYEAYKKMLHLIENYEAEEKRS